VSVTSDSATTSASRRPDAATSVNIAARLVEMTGRFPDKPAVVWPTRGRGATQRCYDQVTFAQLDRLTDRFAHGLSRVGVTRGMRTVLFVKPGADFFAIVFALFKMGAVPVMIDPGIGVRQMRRCRAGIGARAFIGVPIANVLRTSNPAAFRDTEVVVTIGRRWFWGGFTRDDIVAKSADAFATVATEPSDSAAILFTSGSTGPAKGVLYTHGIFDTQVRFLNEHFGFAEDESDLPTFPLFALFDAALGMTAVIPDMDFTHPGSVDPRKLIGPIVDHGLTHMFGSPALLDRLGRYTQENGIKLPTIRRVITAGAPVQPVVLERMRDALAEDAEIHTPYGATEALPVASITGREILADTRRRTERGCGTCVGTPIPGIDVRIIRIDDDPIREWSDELLLLPGTIGEIVVKGPVVTRRYANNSDATDAAKILHGDGFWHRMGDVGYFDDIGRLWFCGRKAHRVTTSQTTLFTVPCEAVFNQHPDVRRSALVGVGVRRAQTPVICIELEPAAKRVSQAKTIGELLALARRHDRTADIDTILFHPGFPVDVRHNSKIFREKLAVWAQRKLRNK